MANSLACHALVPPYCDITCNILYLQVDLDLPFLDDPKMEKNELAKCLEQEINEQAKIVEDLQKLGASEHIVVSGRNKCFPGMRFDIFCCQIVIQCARFGKLQTNCQNIGFSIILKTLFTEL